MFPLAYVLGDILTEVYGFKASRRVIWTGFCALLLTMLTLLLLKVLPAEAFWEQNTGSAAYDSVLGGMFTGGIILASISAYLTGEYLNAVLLSKIKILMKGRHLWLRALVSSIAGEFADSFIFILIATLTKVFPKELFWSLVLTNYLLKMLIEIIVLPVTCRVSRFLKQKEGIDTFDINEKYSPLP